MATSSKRDMKRNDKKNSNGNNMVNNKNDDMMKKESSILNNNDSKLKEKKSAITLPTIKESRNEEDSTQKSNGKTSNGNSKGKIMFIEFSWIYFDMVVVGQIILSISFLMLAFLYTILGSTISEVIGLILLTLYLLLPTVPAYKSMANSRTYSGIKLFCYIQFGEVLQNMFVLTLFLLNDQKLEYITVRRCYLIYFLCIYQLVTIIIVTSCPFKKVGGSTIRRLFGNFDLNDIMDIKNGKNHEKNV
uniref:Transporter n=1 Tax=Parastrongyloides trichosuri TaxID=131310 RepID=A0A0N4Z0B7_PARTI